MSENGERIDLHDGMMHGGEILTCIAWQHDRTDPS